jgi:L-ascorbate peroxidase
MSNNIHDRCKRGVAGGKSWTKNWFEFDNSYFQRYLTPDDPDLLWLPSDRALYDSVEFRPFLLQYAKCNEEFLNDYSAAHKKMSELGSKFLPERGFCLD